MLGEENKVLERVVRLQRGHVTVVIEQREPHRLAEALGNERGLCARPALWQRPSGALEGLAHAACLLLEGVDQSGRPLGVDHGGRPDGERAGAAERVAVEEVEGVTEGGRWPRVDLREGAHQAELGRRVRQRQHRVLTLGEGCEGGL